MFLASESWLYQSSIIWILWWFNTIVNLDILCSYWFSFSNQRVNRKSTVKEENSIEKFFILSLASKSICPKTHWRFLVLNHLHLQNHVSLQLEACSLPSRPQWKVFNFRQTFTLKSCRICFWQQKPDSLNIPKAELNLIYLYMQAQFSAQLQVWFVAWRSQSIFSAVVTSQSKKKVVGFFSCIRILIVPKFQKLILILTWWKLQIWFSA